GVIEGACRHLVKDRMDITGARWRLKSAEAILKLRSLFASGDFDEYFDFHKKQEYKRNHEGNYDYFPLKIAA
ncbi:MAG: ISKra4 family transposase, partial [bacterium]|nr:ISKra4 family transposase [bacterium]